MTVCLRGANVLVARVDPTHTWHDPAHEGLARVGHKGIATCPLTGNGLVRVIGHPRHPNSPAPLGVVLPSPAAIRGLPGHRSWPDDLGMADAALFAPELRPSPSRVTDSDLLALAHDQGGRLATRAPTLTTDVVPGGRKALAGEQHR